MAESINPEDVRHCQLAKDELLKLVPTLKNYSNIGEEWANSTGMAKLVDARKKSTEAATLLIGAIEEIAESIEVAASAFRMTSIAVGNE